jgi:hypothetical protein
MDLLRAWRGKNQDETESRSASVAARIPDYSMDIVCEHEETMIYTVECRVKIRSQAFVILLRK